MFSFKRSLIALVGVLVLVLAALVPLVSRGQGGNPLTRDTRRSFYVTQTGYTGSQALSACAAGYHMASLWEIHDPSNLRYDTQLGFTREDSGFGPPASSDGDWIRTGSDASGSVTAFSTGNCYAWTSASNTDYGTVVFLASTWTSSASVVSPWGVGASVCSNSKRVWCVQD